MNARIAQLLVSLFPRAWQERYSVEFIVFLQDRALTPFSICNVLGCAVQQHVRSLRGGARAPVLRPVLLLSYAYAATFAGGVNLYWTVDDTPLGLAMRSHELWLMAWNLIAVGSVLALAAAVVVALPVARMLFRSAIATRRGDVLLRLAFTPAVVVLVILWLGIVGIYLGGHWLPTPWDIVGDWTAPTNWPPLAARWFLGSITLALLGTVLIGGPISLKRAVELSESVGPTLAIYRLRSTNIAAAVLTGTTLMMTLSVSVWVLEAQRYKPTAFHAHFGGFMNSATSASCIASGLLLGAATLMAFFGARRTARSSSQKSSPSESALV